jgi:lipopolysaccharide biosynthesis glycosyltransferase
LNQQALFYVTDQKGYMLTLHAMASFVLTQRPEFDIYIFCHNFMPDDVAARQAQCAKQGFHLQVLPVDGQLVDGLKTKGHVTATTYLKLPCALDLSKTYQRVLYVDNDILFMAPVELATLPLDEMSMGAVLDVAECGGITDPTFQATCECHGVSNRYFNAGLMLFDGKALAADSGMRDRYFGFLAQHQKTCWYKQNCRTNDQCVMNRLFNGQWQFLPLVYNMQASLKFTSYWGSAKVRHYQGINKFIPPKAWRDDARGTHFVSQIQAFLALPVLQPRAFGSVVYLGNRLRHWRSQCSARRLLPALRVQYPQLRIE